jgi:hypothetical protein
MFSATCRPCRSANCPVGGHTCPSSAFTMRAQSPTAHASVKPWIRMSGSASTRPPSFGADMCFTTGDIVLPIVHTTVAPAIARPSLSRTPSGVASATRAFSTMVMPAASILTRVNSRRAGLISGRSWSREWIRVTRMSPSATFWKKRRLPRTRSLISPAVSTPL